MCCFCCCFCCSSGCNRAAANRPHTRHQFPLFAFSLLTDSAADNNLTSSELSFATSKKFLNDEILKVNTTKENQSLMVEEDEENKKMIICNKNKNNNDDNYSDGDCRNRESLLKTVEQQQQPKMSKSNFVALLSDGT